MKIIIVKKEKKRIYFVGVTNFMTFCKNASPAASDATTIVIDESL